jgi:hypothetical protein
LYWERLERGRTLSFKPPKQIFYPQVNCPRVFRAGCGKGNRNIPKRSFKFWKLRSPGCHQDVTRMSPGQVEFHWFPNGRQLRRDILEPERVHYIIKKNSALFNLF